MNQRSPIIMAPMMKAANAIPITVPDSSPSMITGSDLDPSLTPDLDDPAESVTWVTEGSET
ncbi:hypothetical protein DPMN_154074 [Dreissena polymorpha]|uniref:Uncharacterized protein n=1 Tax=Dreissena polymorpha TaxID=45954 RepID=A0A9D4FP95_DREPO|nr:hypothetical protein DPMN_154074 [Dreissena polymorpha]